MARRWATHSDGVDDRVEAAAMQKILKSTSQSWPCDVDGGQKVRKPTKEVRRFSHTGRQKGQSC